MGCSSKIGSELHGKNEVVMVGCGQNEPRSTVDAVDLEFKLSSQCR